METRGLDYAAVRRNGVQSVCCSFHVVDSITAYFEREQVFFDLGRLAEPLHEALITVSGEEGQCPSIVCRRNEIHIFVSVKPTPG